MNIYSLAVLVLFEREDVFVEVFLKLLIGKIDVELLKSIHLKILEPKNVQNPNEGKGLFACKRNTKSCMSAMVQGKVKASNPATYIHTYV